MGDAVNPVSPRRAPVSIRGAYGTALQGMTQRYEDLVRTLSVLREIDSLGDGDPPFSVLCSRLIETISKHYDAENCSVMLLDEAHRYLYLWAATSYMQDQAACSQGEEALARKFEVGQGIAGRVVATGTPVRIDDTLSAPLFVPVPGSPVNVRSLLCVPLRWRQGVLGVVNLSHSLPAFFIADDEASLVMVAERSARLIASSRKLHRHKVVEQCYQLACERAGDGIIVLDEAGNVTVANGRAEELLGSSLTGRTCSMERWARQVHHDDIEAFRVARERLLMSGQPQTCAYRLRSDGGAYRHVEERLTVVPAVNDQPRQVVCVLRDVTARVEHETEKRDLEAQLRHAQKMEAIGELAGGITHDFNNILTGILANVSLARASDDPLELPELLRDIEAAARQASILTRRLLSMSRRSKVECAACDVALLIEEVTGIVRNTMDRRIVIEHSSEPGLWPVLADRSQIHQVLLNLCVNARDALLGKVGEPGADVRISVTARNEVIDDAYCTTQVEALPGLYVCIEVSDTGAGIAEEIRARIFEPFFTTREGSGGTGLGLAIAYGVIKQHGGWVSLDSTLGHGSTFRFYLPRAVDAVPSKEDAPARSCLTHGNATVLLADDEEMMRRTAKRLLGKLGYGVIMARDGVECVEQFQAHAGEVDLIILDLNMPRLNGNEALSRIREIDPAVPVIISSGHTVALPEDPAVSYGPVSYMHKPYTLEVMSRTLRDALTNRRTPAANSACDASRGRL